jgi:hypothetical protein
MLQSLAQCQACSRVYAVIGMISAAVCSWLSGEKSAPRLNEKEGRPTNERHEKV